MPFTITIRPRFFFFYSLARLSASRRRSVVLSYPLSSGLPINSGPADRAHTSNARRWFLLNVMQVVDEKRGTDWATVYAAGGR